MPKKYLLMMGLVMLLSLTATPAVAQRPYIDVSNLVSLGNVTSSRSIPALVDIDADGDVDVFIGTEDGTVAYFENIGTPTNPTFVERTGAANPLDGPIAVSGNAAPTFADMDNDGDFDLYVGQRDGSIVFYDNEGTPSEPDFAEITGPAVPLTNVDVANDSVPFLIDFDNDGDNDAFIGGLDGSILYYRNSSALSPIFELVPAADSPVGTINVGLDQNSSPALVDIDNDADLDLFVGRGDGTMFFYQNNNGDFGQTSYVPITNLDVGEHAHPRFADVDNDGDVELLVGRNAGTVNYYRSDERISILTMQPSGLPLAPGSLLTYTIILTHTGDLTATTFIADALPVETTLINSVTVMPSDTAIINVTAPPTDTEETNAAQITAARINISNIKLETAQQFTVTIPVQITDTNDIVGQTITNTAIATSTAAELNAIVTRVVTVTQSGSNRVDLPIILRQ